MAGLLMSYFTAEDESLFLAYSRDGRNFTALNDGRPVLPGTVGNRSLRDPFIAAGPDGRFHLLATDGWTSTAIVHASSEDLLEWSEQELIPVMADVPGAHNAWAPEFFLDPDAGLYYVIWSSVVDPGATADNSWQHVGQDHRIWCCTTSDFRSYSAPRIFFDPGHSVIDATVVYHDGLYTMAYKDERGMNAPTTSHKDIHLTTFRSPGSSFSHPHGPVTPSAVEGPTLFRREDEWVLLFDHYLEGRYGSLCSSDGLGWRTAAVTVPPGTRHASVVRLKQEPGWLEPEAAA